MHGRPEQVGKKFKCPDCGALTVVPPPPEPKRINIPAAMEGEQYELWAVDDQPLPSEILARQPTYIAVKCRQCDTLIYATEDQVGQKLPCPDCGTKNIVVPSRVPKPKRSPLAKDAPVLDPAAAPGDRPPAISSELQKRIDEDSQHPRSEFGDKLDRRGRAIPPSWPLITGNLSFPFYSGCRTRWAALALGLLAPVGLFLEGVPAWANWQGDTMGAMEAMAGLAETMIGAVILIIWLAAASNIFLAIVTETSEGHDHIQKWPSFIFIDSMSEMLPVTVAIMFSAAPGWSLGHLVASEHWQFALMSGATLLLGFPICLLSQLSGMSTWNLIDLRVLGGMVRCPFSTALFYIQTAALAAVCVWATFAVVQIDLLFALALTPLYVGCAIIYARLLGRLGLRLAQKMPPRDEA